MKVEDRPPDEEEIAILNAIYARDMRLMPRDYHPADLAWLSLYGYVALGPIEAIWWPEKATLTKKGLASIGRSGVESDSKLGT